MLVNGGGICNLVRTFHLHIKFPACVSIIIDRLSLWQRKKAVTVESLDI